MNKYRVQIFRNYLWNFFSLLIACEIFTHARRREPRPGPFWHIYDGFSIYRNRNFSLYFNNNIVVKNRRKKSPYIDKWLRCFPDFGYEWKRTSNVRNRFHPSTVQTGFRGYRRELVRSFAVRSHTVPRIAISKRQRTTFKTRYLHRFSEEIMTRRCFRRINADRINDLATPRTRSRVDRARQVYHFCLRVFFFYKCP